MPGGRRRAIKNNGSTNSPCFVLRQNAAIPILGIAARQELALLPDQTEGAARTIRSAPKELCLRSRLFAGAGGKLRGPSHLLGGASFPRGRGYIKTAPLGGRLGFIKTSQAKAFPHVGAGVPLKLSRQSFPARRGGRRVSHVPAEGLGPQTQERPAEYSAGL